MRLIAVALLGAMVPGCALSLAPDFSNAIPDAAGDAAPDRDGPAALVARARPIAPLSTSFVSHARPSFRWENLDGADGARVELCRDRAMSLECQRWTDLGSVTQPSAALAPGRWFWRLRGTTGGTVADEPGPTWQFTVGARSTAVDTSWGSTSDFDGNGRDEIVVGVGITMTTPGVVDVFAGPARDPLSPPVTMLTLDDPQSRRFGAALSTIGDTDGDGFPDLLVVSSAQAPGNSRAYLYRGGPAGLSTTPSVTLSAASTMFYPPGQTVAGLGDSNGDGYADAALVVTVDNPNGMFTHQVLIFLGGPNGLSTTPSQVLTPEGNEFSALVVAGAGDVNGDGYADLAVGSLSAVVGAENVHSLCVYLGSVSGYRLTVHTAGPDVVDDGFGGAVANGGDLNGDGYCDLVVGSGLVSTSAGSVYVFPGRALGPSSSPSVVIAGDEPNAYFGGSVASAGDVDGDGFADLVVGTVADLPSQWGRAYLYRGSETGLRTDSRATLLYSQAGGENQGLFATQVSGVGDTDGDGHPEVGFAVARTDTSTGVVSVVAAVFATPDAPPGTATWTATDGLFLSALPVIAGATGQ